MFMIVDGEVFDGDLDVLLEQLDLLERQLYRLRGEANTSPDPDGEGIVDRVEALIGLALVACQSYVNRTYPQLGDGDRAKAIRFGPLLASGVSAAQVIDAAANWWKHSEEWGREEARARGVECRRALAQVGVAEGGSYPLVGVLHALGDQAVPGLAFLGGILAVWRDTGRGVPPP